MEILVLILLYYLSQNPDFPESVKPLMGQLKNSEKMLSFLNDLSSFAQTFSALKKEVPPKKQEKEEKQDKQDKKEEEKKPQSPTAGIADDFIQQILEGYLQKH